MVWTTSGWLGTQVRSILKISGQFEQLWGRRDSKFAASQVLASCRSENFRKTVGYHNWSTFIMRWTQTPYSRKVVSGFKIHQGQCVAYFIYYEIMRQKLNIRALCSMSRLQYDYWGTHRPLQSVKKWLGCGLGDPWRIFRHEKLRLTRLIAVLFCDGTSRYGVP